MTEEAGKIEAEMERVERRADLYHLVGEAPSIEDEPSPATVKDETNS
jgi:hypothetical protein